MPEPKTLFDTNVKFIDKKLTFKIDGDKLLLFAILDKKNSQATCQSYQLLEAGALKACAIGYSFEELAALPDAVFQQIDGPDLVLPPDEEEEPA